MKNKKFLGILAVLLIFIIAILVAIFVVYGRKETVEDTGKVEDEVIIDEPLDEPDEEDDEIIDEPSYTSLLTGEDMDIKFEGKRPIALMIENTSMCQPQYGIGKAGIIYECPVEGGITRLMGIFEDYTSLERFGNVRSCRPYYVYIASEFDAIYVHFGQSTQGKALLSTGIVDNLNGLDGSISEKVFYRSSDKKAPHNAYTSTKGIREGIKVKGYRKKISKDVSSHFAFTSKEEPVTLQGGQDAYALAPYYTDNHPYFVYDEKDGLYYRFQFNDKQIDAANGGQIAVKNIILQDVKSAYYPDGYRLDLTMTGSGSGKYFTNGRYIDITWKKDTDTARTMYFDESGNELRINPGKTWVCIIESKYSDNNRIYKTKEEFK